MPKRPATIAEYIDAAPAKGQPHLRRVYGILKAAAPKAEEAIKWGTPFFVEPRFLFAFSAHKAHLNVVVLEDGLKAFAKELKGYKTTPRGMLQVGYDEQLPEALIRKIAKWRVKVVKERKGDSFW